MLREWTQSESLVKHGLAVGLLHRGSYGVREAARLGLEGDEAAVGLVELYRCAGVCCTILIMSGTQRRRSIPLLGSLICGNRDGRRRCCTPILAHADYSGVKPETHLDQGAVCMR